MTTHTVTTFCRVCEALCGLVAEVDGEQIVAIRPDRHHPVSAGYSCVKGLGLGQLHHDPDRLKFPLKRVNGALERISWSQAIAEIGARVKQLRRRHGDQSIALYTGNPTYFSMQNVLFSSAFLEAIGSHNLFASHSVDANPKFDVATQMYGLSIVQPIVDIARTEFIMCLGTNPVVSQMSIVQLPNALQALQAVEARGGRVIIVDPRRTETAARVGEHLPITPGADVYLLLAMMHRLVCERSVPRAAIDAVAHGWSEVVAAVRPWTPERCARLCDIEAEQLRALADAFADADGGCLYMSTGVNMGPFGSLSYWLLQALHLAAGQMDRAGGLLMPEGAFDVFSVAKLLGLGAPTPHRTRAGGWHHVAGAFPVAALADEIEHPGDDRIRALFVSCGNPVHSVPGNAIAAALDKLDLLVSIDIYQNETSAYADYVLPATDMLERSDYPVSWALLQPTPHAQYTPAVVRPKYERREEWRIFCDLAVASGASPLNKSACALLPRINGALARLPGDIEITPDELLALLLALGRKTTLAQLKERPSGVLLPPTEPGSFLGRRVPTPDKKVRLAPARIIADLPRLDAYEAQCLVRDDDTLALIGRRERKSHNSWMHNNRYIRHRQENEALLHPDDARARGIDDGGWARVVSPEGALTVCVKHTDDVKPGVVVVPHGWGHRDSGLEHAKTLGGGNINRVIEGDAQQLEPVSGQAIMVAQRVRVESAPAPLAEQPRFLSAIASAE